MLSFLATWRFLQLAQMDEMAIKRDYYNICKEQSPSLVKNYSASTEKDPMYI